MTEGRSSPACRRRTHQVPLTAICLVKDSSLGAGVSAFLGSVSASLTTIISSLLSQLASDFAYDDEDIRNSSTRSSSSTCDGCGDADSESSETSLQSEEPRRRHPLGHAPLSRHLGQRVGHGKGPPLYFFCIFDANRFLCRWYGWSVVSLVPSVRAALIAGLTLDCQWVFVRLQLIATRCQHLLLFDAGNRRLVRLSLYIRKVF